VFFFDTHETWAAAARFREDAIKEANATIRKESKKLGIPDCFAPEVDLHWYGRGESASKWRREELRTVAHGWIDNMARQAKLDVEAFSVEIQTKLIESIVKSREAVEFLNTMPTATSLVPEMLTVEDVEKTRAMAGRVSRKRVHGRVPLAPPCDK